MSNTVTKLRAFFAKRPILSTFLAIIFLLVLLIYVRTGGHNAQVRTINDLPLSTPSAELAGVNCEAYRIPVKMTPDGWFNYDIVGELCWRGELAGKTLLLLNSGLAYGPVYWDFPYQSETYSFVQAAVAEDYATFNYHRLGIGASDHPLGFRINADVHAYIAHQIINLLESEVDYEAVVTVGHSFGSAISVAIAYNYPEDVDGVIVTGFIHNVNPQYAEESRETSQVAAISPKFSGSIFDPTYFTSSAGASGRTFYVSTNSDPNVRAIDEANKQTLTLGELLSIRTYFGPQSKSIEVPVLVLVGDQDIIGCGGELDCNDQEAVIANENEAYSNPGTCVETYVLEDTGHNLNLHNDAADNFRLMLDWLNRRIGETATQPCAA
ncbi:MAG: alpha/beta hydrolase [Chloroflexota bacterium]